MGSWLDRMPAVGERGESAGRCMARSELIRFESSTGRVFEARRLRTHDRDRAAASLILTAAHRDRDLLRPAMNFLANQGVSVYVDVRGGGIPDEGVAEYSGWLRTCLAQDRKLVLVATQEGLTSPWAPWQLGLAEGTLGLENVAVLPVEDYGYFRGTPLVGLYPVIRCRDGTWMLTGPRGRVGPSLEEWLTS